MARLSLVEYLGYLEGTNTSRSVYEGEDVLNAGHIILCGKLNSSTHDKILICALCLQSSALNSDPHHIQGELHCNSRKGSIKIKNMLCSCKAGNSGRCKHISAVLIKCTRWIILLIQKGAIVPSLFLIKIKENLEDLEIISQTDMKCVWSAQKHITNEKYKAVPIKDMPCFQNKIDQCKLEVDDNKIYNFFISQAYSPIPLNSALEYQQHPSDWSLNFAPYLNMKECEQ